MKNKKSIKKIVYCTGTRADYGLARPVLLQLRKTGFQIDLIVTGMHLMSEFGNTIDEIKLDGFNIHRVESIILEDSHFGMASYVGKCLYEMTLKLKDINPDLMLVLGDRGEMLAGAIAAAYMHIPVAHFRGGEVTSTIDDPVRHAITKLSHLHLCTTEKSAERISKMGEEIFRIHVVGDPGIDNMKNILGANNKKNKDFEKKLYKDYGLTGKPYIVLLQHPVSVEYGVAAEHISNSLSAVSEIARKENMDVIVVYPNADAGGRTMIKEIEKYRKNKSFIIFKNIPHNDFLFILKNASVMVGNSSSGITESASLKLPVVNIGTRQFGRERNNNVIDSSYDSIDIKKSISKALSKEFNNMLNGKNIYGNGNTGDLVVDIIKNLSIEDDLMQKKLAY